MKKVAFVSFVLVVLASAFAVKSAYAPGPSVSVNHNPLPPLGNNTIMVSNTGGPSIWSFQIDVNGAQVLPLSPLSIPPGWILTAYDGNLVRWQATTPQAAIQAGQTVGFTISTVDDLSIGNPVCGYFFAWVAFGKPPASIILGSGWYEPVP